MFAIITDLGTNVVGGYVLGYTEYVVETENNIYDFDLSVYDEQYLNCYKLGDNELILDEVKKAEQMAREEAERQAEQHKADIDEQTLKLAQMFVDMGVNVDDFLDRLDAQVLYSALMTDSLLPEEDTTTEGVE